MSWKTRVGDYVRCKNEWESGAADGDEFLAIIDRKSRFLQKQRYENIRRLHKERKLKPLRNQTRLRLLQVMEQEDRVEAVLELRRLFCYELKQMEHKEERLEIETVQLRQQGNDWQITGITPDMSDSLPFLLSQRTAADSEAEAAVWSTSSGQMSQDSFYKSRPLIHSQVFTHAPYGVRQRQYDRYKVVQYADKWWDHPNPNYLTFDVDCTNYVSQCLYAGNAPMEYTGKRGSGWWYQGKKNGRELWSYSWAVAHSFQLYLENSRKGLTATQVENPWELTIGDVINYAWDGNKFEHSTIVTGLDATGMPLVNAHTVSSKQRYWEYTDSPAWTEETRYEFFHIADQF